MAEDYAAELFLLDALSQDMALALFREPHNVVTLSHERLVNWLARVSLVIAALQQREEGRYP